MRKFKLFFFSNNMQKKYLDLKQHVRAKFIARMSIINCSNW